jgi:hypothetical protein
MGIGLAFFLVCLSDLVRGRGGLHVEEAIVLGKRTEREKMPEGQLWVRRIIEAWVRLKVTCGKDMVCSRTMLMLTDVCVDQSMLCVDLARTELACNLYVMMSGHVED